MPFEFILDLLYPLEPTIKKMFGVSAIYIEEKMYFALRQKEEDTLDNGIWVATDLEHHESIKAQFPSLTHLNNVPIKKWLLLHEDHDDFETVATELCELIKKGDSRVGTLPKPKKKKKK